MAHQTALIVGASRGLGLGLAQEFVRRGWHVIATQRTAGAELAALRTLAEGRLEIEAMDTTSEADAAALRAKLGAKKLDLLFVNAGIANDPEAPIHTVPAETFAQIMITNAFAPVRLLEAFADAMAPDGISVAMTSILGSVELNTTGRWEAYRASKAALNTLLRSFAVRHPEANVVAMAPGWTRTAMGGADAPLDVATSVRGMTDVLEARRGATGAAYLEYSGRTLPW